MLSENIFQFLLNMLFAIQHKSSFYLLISSQIEIVVYILSHFQHQSVAWRKTFMVMNIKRTARKYPFKTNKSNAKIFPGIFSLNKLGKKQPLFEH